MGFCLNPNASRNSSSDSCRDFRFFNAFMFRFCSSAKKGSSLSIKSSSLLYFNLWIWSFFLSFDRCFQVLRGVKTMVRILSEKIMRNREIEIAVSRKWKNTRNDAPRANPRPQRHHFPAPGPTGRTHKRPLRYEPGLCLFSWFQDWTLLKTLLL